jgi:hypothetical protein
MYKIFIVATPKKKNNKDRNNTWTMYTIFIHCCKPKKKDKEKTTLGECTIRYKGVVWVETEHAGGRHACLGEKTKSLR